jgi:hypothetical protein
MYLGLEEKRSCERHWALLSMIVIASFWHDVPFAHAASFKGAWFDVTYPEGWVVVPSLPSEGRPGGFDSVFLRSPDGAVEFYVFAPQWSGAPRDIQLDPATERLESSQISESAGRKITWYTISAKNGAYTRSYQDTKGDSTRSVVGIKYLSEDAYRRHRSAYLKFKGSLRQFAD